MIPYFGPEMIQALLDYWKRPQARSSKVINNQAPIKFKREALSRRKNRSTTEITLHWLQRSSISRAARVLQMWPVRRREVKDSNLL
jgi:hypothetical protein